MRRLVVATKAGLARVEAAVVVDASGDADVCHFAGLGYELAGAEEPAQTLTTTFRLVNVDTERRRAVGKEELHRLMAEAAASGAYDLPRRDGSDHITPVEGMTATVMTRLPSARRQGGRVVNATDPVLLTEAEMAGRRQALEYVRFLVDRVPGYERARLAALSTQVGVRETRRVVGDARLTAGDVLSARQFDDQIGLCGAPLEDHHDGDGTRWRYLPDGQVVGIPFGTLVARDAANVLVAGRCFSATHDAHASVRSMAQCMAMGQAAGTAAALAATARRRGPRPGLRAAPGGAGGGRGHPGAGPGHGGAMSGAENQVRTVLGDVPSSELGMCFAHEHLVIDGGVAKLVNPEISLQRVEDAVAELAPCVAAGLGAVVDAMPADAGRNVAKLAEISRRAGVHVVAATGLHHARYYGERHWGELLDRPRSWPSCSSPS